MASTAAASHGLRRRRHRSDLEVATAMENTPGDASDFVGKRNRQFETIEPPGCGLDPGFEAMLLPALRVDEKGAGCPPSKYLRVLASPFTVISKWTRRSMLSMAAEHSF